MLHARLTVCVISVALFAVETGTVWSQNFPSKPIRIVTSGAGGGTDFASRMIALGLTENLNQQVIVDNRASGVIPGDIVHKASPDGYQEIARTQPIGGKCWTMATIANGRIYERSTTEVACLDVSAK